jgi:hypothetical protein
MYFTTLFAYKDRLPVQSQPGTARRHVPLGQDAKANNPDSPTDVEKKAAVFERRERGESHLDDSPTDVEKKAAMF